MSRTGFVYSDKGLLHDTGALHPENANRLRAILAAFANANIMPEVLKPKPAAHEDLLRIHSGDHILNVKDCCEGKVYYGDQDTPMVRDSYEAALLAAGGAIEACRLVLEGKFDNVFSCMRPPGHHAEHNRAMGFCLFNSVAIAAAWLREERELARVSILDWDVHHGNGTQNSFYDDPTVQYISLHQYPHYPGTGRPDERGAGNANLNVCLAPGTPAAEWMRAFDEQVLPELDRFKPEFLLISAGFDAHRADPLGDQNLEADHFAEITRKVKGFAEGRVVSLLEGGYNLNALGQSAVAHFLALREG